MYNNNGLICSLLLLGCGGTFNQSYGMMNLSKSYWDWETRECSWTIYNPGIENAVLLMSIWKIKFQNCGYKYGKFLQVLFLCRSLS